VIIPTYNREEILTNCLEKLLVNTTIRCSSELIHSINEFNFEVIVSDDSEQTCHNLDKKFEISVIEGPKKGPAANRNFGAKHSRGKWLIFIDDDTSPCDKFIFHYGTTLERNNYNLDIMEGAIKSLESINSPFYRMSENLSGNNFFSGNISFNANVFKKLGGFDEEMIIMEDLEIKHRILSSKLKTQFVRKAFVFHPAQKFGIKFLIERIFHYKWLLLLKLKCQNGEPKNILSELLVSTYEHLHLQLRTTNNLIKHLDKSIWFNQIIWQIIYWGTVPIVIPYLWFWSIKYNISYKKGRITIYPTIK
jgi:glycosyltransferase involved in cell wall biosynthesis